MFKLFKSSLGPCCSLATVSHLQTSELVCGEVLFNSLLESSSIYKTLTWPRHVTGYAVATFMLLSICWDYFRRSARWVFRELQSRKLAGKLGGKWPAAYMEGYKRSSFADSSLGREIPFLIHYSSSRTNVIEYIYMTLHDSSMSQNTL